jgi:hypothetical protein
MTPEEFKERYLEGMKSGFRDAPEDVQAKLLEQFSQFTTYPLELLQRSSLSPEDVDFLSRTGLPQSAAPALNFRNLYEPFPEFETNLHFKDHFVIGSASRNRLLAISKESGEVLCFDPVERVIILVNDSLEKFAECLCLFQEYRDRNEIDVCLEAMAEVDLLLMEYESFWEDETRNFFNNVADLLNEAARRKNQ